MTVACIAIGSNLGDRAASLERAARLLAQTPGVRLVRRSRDYETPAEGGPPGQPDFLNGAVVVETDLPPGQLLAACQGIEAALGRPPPAERVPAGPRVIDLDILLYDDRVIHDEELTIPHPRMHLRRFVLEPLAEVAPAARHPLLDGTVVEMLSWLGRPGESTR